MSYIHTREHIATHNGRHPGEITKHTFGFKAFGKYLVVTWCWC